MSLDAGAYLCMYTILKKSDSSLMISASCVCRWCLNLNFFLLSDEMYLVTRASFPWFHIRFKAVVFSAFGMRPWHLKDECIIFKLHAGRTIPSRCSIIHSFLRSLEKVHFCATDVLLAVSLRVLAHGPENFAHLLALHQQPGT
jgi:hypothetical protein